MGRLGSGELITIVFGLTLPLAHLGIGAALAYWGRRLMKEERGRPAWVAFYAAIAGLVAPLLGVLVSTLGLAAAFGNVASYPAAERAAALAQGISQSMNAAVVGVILAVLLYLVSLSAALRAPAIKR